MDRELVARLHANARVLRAALGVDRSTTCRSCPLVVGEPEAAMARCAAALRATASSPRRSARRPSPTSRLRAVATAAHTESELREAAGSISAYGAVHG